MIRLTIDISLDTNNTLSDDNLELFRDLIDNALAMMNRQMTEINIEQDWVDESEGSD